MNFTIKGDEAKALIQSILEANRYARGIETVCSSIEPIADDATADQLRDIANRANQIAAQLMSIYKSNAKEAFNS